MKPLTVVELEELVERRVALMPMRSICQSMGVEYDALGAQYGALLAAVTLHINELRLARSLGSIPPEASQLEQWLGLAGAPVSDTRVQ